MDYHTARYSESGAGTRRGPAHLGSTLFGDLQTDAGGVSGMSLFDAMCYAEGSLQPFCSLVDDDAALATEEVLAVEDDHHKQCIPSLSSELHSQCRILEDQLSPAFLLVQYAAIFKRRDASGVTLQGWRKPQTESMARKPARTPVLPPAFPEKPERGQYVLGRLHRRILTQHVYTPTLRSSGEIARVPDTGEKRHSERARRKRDNEKRIDEVWNIPREKASILSVPAPVYKRPISRVARALGSCETVGAVRTQERRGWASGRGFESGLQPTSSSLVLKKASTTTLSYCPSQRNWGMGRMAYFQSPRWREESLRTAIREGSVSAFTGDLDDSRHEKAARIINQAHQTLGTLKRYGSAKYKAALRFLYRNVRNSEFDRGTETVHLFLKEMGINIKSNFTYPNTHFILVSGTLGKTSVATKIAAGLAESGLTVGVFTGPHLACLRERISVNGSLISESEIVYWVHVIRQTIAKTGTIPSFWECITLMALGHFTWQKCDYVVWETQKFRLAFDLRKVTLWTMRCLAIPCLAPRFDECASSSLSSTRETVREFLQCCNVLPKTATYSVVCGSFATPLWSKLQKHSPFRNITNVMLLGHQYRETMNDENTRIAM